MGMRFMLAALAGVFLSCAAGANTLTVFDVDGAADQTDRVTTFGRAFLQRAIAECPVPTVGGAALDVLHYQADLKNRWPDGSAKFAVISVRQTIRRGSSARIDGFRSGACNNGGYISTTSTPVTFATFAGGNWGAAMEATAGGTTVVRDARQMLDASNPDQPDALTDCGNRYWLKGPVVTQVIVEDCTARFSHDFGWHWDGAQMNEDSALQYRSLHPRFILSFYPHTNNVKVEAILENNWSSRTQDQVYSFVIKTGRPLAEVYSHPAFTHRGLTRWRKVAWSGVPFGHIRIDHDFAYWISTKYLPFYDLVNARVDPGDDYANFVRSDMGDIMGHAQMIQAYSANEEGAPIQRWDLDYLYNMKTCGKANGACAKAWFQLTGERGQIDRGLRPSVEGGAGIWAANGNIPYHSRESRTAEPHNPYFYCPEMAHKDALSNLHPCTQGSGEYLGRVLSRHTFWYNGWIWSGPEKPVGTVTHGNWYIETSHWVDNVYVWYLLTGDFYALEEVLMQGAHHIFGGTQPFGYIDPGFGSARTWAWGLQGITRAALLAPDGTPEARYFASMVRSNTEVQEGFMNITGTSLTPSGIHEDCSGYRANSFNRWDWGRCDPKHGNNLQIGLHNLVAPFCNWAAQTPDYKHSSYNATARVLSAAGTNPVELAVSNSNKLGGQGAIWGATGAWASGGPRGTGINGLWTVIVKNATTVTIPFDAGKLRGQPLTGAVYLATDWANWVESTESDEPWMNGFVMVVLGHLQELGFHEVDRIATEAYKSLVEQVLDAHYNPYLIALYTRGVKGGTGACSVNNPYWTDWADVRTKGVVPPLRDKRSFDGDHLWSPPPCGDHGYYTVPRAAGTYILNTSSVCNLPGGGTGTCTGADAWAWLQSHVPFFGVSIKGSTNCGATDRQIKFALAPRGH